MNSNDKAAILEAAMRFSQPRFQGHTKYSPDGQFDREIQNVFRVFFNEGCRVRRGSRFRAWRFLHSRLERSEIIALDLLFRERSTTQLRAILRQRTDNETPDGGKARRASELEYRNVTIAVEVYALMDDGLSLDQAIEKSTLRKKYNLAATTVKQDLKKVRHSAKERGFVDQFAPTLANLSGALVIEDLDEPLLSVERITRRGRQPKKNSNSPPES